LIALAESATVRKEDKAMNVNVAEVPGTLAEALDRLAGARERVVLTRRGKRIAALVGLQDLELLERLEDQADLQAARQAKAEGGKPIPLEKIMSELGIRPAKKAGKRSKA
jgi:antitoxin (DNA-binding transcriptional repressor) of toxin-antitoxin stability system